ncbi:MAG: RNA polymerase sigma factor, partial [Bacteroidales bacterium]|nr:RNA polymerase sigma factor [Bacteroidales bacterium]
EPTDDELIQGCRENNRKSQEMLYRRYARAMFNVCLVYEHDRDKAKDILQDAFIKIFRNLDRYDGKSPVKCWMKKIISNTAIDHFRKDHHQPEFIPIENVPSPLSNDETVASILETQDIISQVNRLPDGARMIFQLHAIEGYTHRQIAKLLHISEGTSKSQIYRAKYLLRHWIGDYELKYKVIGGKE